MEKDKKEKVYELMQKAAKVSKTIGETETQLQGLNEILWNIIQQVFSIIESEEEKPKKLPYIDCGEDDTG